MLLQQERERCCSLWRYAAAWATPLSLIWGQWLRFRLVRLRQWKAIDTRLASLTSGSIERDRRRRSGKRTTYKKRTMQYRLLLPICHVYWLLLTKVYIICHFGNGLVTCVMLMSVSLGHAERSSSSSRLRAKSEAPGCRRNCSKSFCVTSLGRSSKGNRGGLKNPILPKVLVNFGPLSPCGSYYITSIEYEKLYYQA